LPRSQAPLRSCGKKTGRTFGCVGDLNSKIRRFINGWNDRSHPFAWTKTGDQILKKANSKKTSDAGH